MFAHTADIFDIYQVYDIVIDIGLYRGRRLFSTPYYIVLFGSLMAFTWGIGGIFLLAGLNERTLGKWVSGLYKGNWEEIGKMRKRRPANLLRCLG